MLRQSLRYLISNNFSGDINSLMTLAYRSTFSITKMLDYNDYLLIGLFIDTDNIISLKIYIGDYKDLKTFSSLIQKCCQYLKYVIIILILQSKKMRLMNVRRFNQNHKLRGIHFYSFYNCTLFHSRG